MDSLIAFTDKEPKDFMVPSRWGTVGRHSQASRYLIRPMLIRNQIDKREDPYAPQTTGGGCCTVM